MNRLIPPHRLHLQANTDLVTTYEQRRAGFVALALERNERATPFVDQARALKAAANQVARPAGLLELAGIGTGLLTAAGLSDKAAGHMREEDKDEAVRNLIEKYLEPAGENFVEELVYRFLLTRGDTLGGSMRNIGGAMAQRKLLRAIIAALRIAGLEFRWLDSRTSKWQVEDKDDVNVADRARALTWLAKTGPRTLICNLKLPFIGNNVDLALLAAPPEQVKTVLGAATVYLAVGELKGGIDPAGADEHWKTASKALDRIRAGFQKAGAEPAVFFVGAAIEETMSKEIWEELENGVLTNAANLNNDEQLNSICSWLSQL